MSGGPHAGQDGPVRTRLAPLLLLPALVVTGCSSGSSRTASPAALDAGTPTASTTAASAATRAPAVSASPSARASATTAAPRTVTPAGATSSPATTRATAAAAALQGTAPGTYTSDTSGSVTIGASKQDAAGTQTLTISALRGGTQHSTVHGDQGDTAQDLVVRPTGTYLASLTLTSPAFTKQFRPSPAALLVPDPAKPGAAWSWSATSTDGRTTAEATNRITGTQAVTVGGRPVATAVVQTHLVLSGDLTYTADLTTYWSPQYRLPVKDRTVGKGTYSGIPFATDITSLLRSVTPS
jgi:hypothetical protein